MTGAAMSGQGSTVPPPSTASAMAANASSGMTGDVANATMSCPDVTLELGIFFDGTGNNRSNANQGGEGSYGNDLSNVAKLHPRYYGRNRDVRNSCGGYATRYGSLYVEGIGTTGGEDDSTLFGQGAGVGPTGVENRVFEAAVQVGTIINRLSPGVEPREIVMDVFGFSRGAAAARHFVNAFNRGQLTYRRDFWLDRHAFLPEGRNVRFRFVGVFDTVASIQYRGGQNNHGDLNLNLSNGSADTIFHLTAEHEIRENFPLTDTRGAGSSRVLPGVHSDIGGGYAGTGDDVIVEMPRSYIETSHSRAQARRTSELQRLNAGKTAAAAPYVAEGYILASDIQQAFVYEATPVRTFTIPGGYGSMPIIQYEFKIETRLRRSWVQPDMAKIGLHTMHKKAQDSGVPFHGLPGNSAYNWPNDPIFRAAAQTIKNGGTPTTAQRAHILRNYMHHSAHFNDVYPVVGAPMRPAAGRRRRIIANRPGQAE
jgi:hypothetical protein